MIVVIDNYDSFSFNLVQMIGELLGEDAEPEELLVIRNDTHTAAQIMALAPTRIVLSPGTESRLMRGVRSRLSGKRTGKSHCWVSVWDIRRFVRPLAAALSMRQS